MTTSRKLLCGVYAVIAVVALIATWTQTIAYTHDGVIAFFDNFWHDARVELRRQSTSIPGLRLPASTRRWYRNRHRHSRDTDFRR